MKGVIVLDIQKDTLPEISAKSETYDWIQCFVTALVCSILIFLFIGRIIRVDGISMNPTLFNNEEVVISNLFYEPEYGDIVVITKASFSDEPIVKRVIATQGQTVDINFDTGQVWVDGVLLNEHYIAEPTHRFYDVQFPQTVPEGCIFVMGDNRNKSTDSRASEIGMVDKRCIMGRVYFVILPFSRIGKV
ncbi:MAG: signal peptidase I [Clostridiales bacterium]|nr:signal peptidase I [Clostridiales bacterium]